jgi:hypothetical protein
LIPDAPKRHSTEGQFDASVLESLGGDRAFAGISEQSTRHPAEPEQISGNRIIEDTGQRLTVFTGSRRAAGTST